LTTPQAPANPQPAATPPDIGGFSASPQEPQNPNPPEDPGAATPPSAGTPDPEILSAYRAEDGSLDETKLLERLAADQTSAAERLEKYGEAPQGDATYEIPDKITTEEGQEISIDLENPFLQNAFGQFKELGVGQKAVEGFVKLYAESVMKDVAGMQEGFAESLRAQAQQEFESLGDKRVARFDSLVSNIDQALSTEEQKVEGAGQKILSQVRTREVFELLEKLFDAAGKQRQPSGQAPPEDIDLNSAKALYANRS
jgi:hypothetical protein